MVLKSKALSDENIKRFYSLHSLHRRLNCFDNPKFRVCYN